MEEEILLRLLDGMSEIVDKFRSNYDADCDRILDERDKAVLIEYKEYKRGESGRRDR